MSTSRPTKVLIADDSGLSRRMLSDLVASDADLHVVATAADGKRAIAAVAQERPDILLMDVMMPVMDGLQATRELMSTSPLPIVLVSELVGRDADLNFKAMEAGALDVLRKPSAESIAGADGRARFLRKIKLLARVPVVRRRISTRAARPLATPGAASTAPAPERPRSRVASAPQPIALVTIGASTGGPPAILAILSALDGALSVPLVICQHMTEGFIAGMAKWLDDQLPSTRVEVAASGDTPQPGVVYLAPDDAHLQLSRGRFALSHAAAPYHPSIDLLFESISGAGVARSTAAVVLTGMGNDGAKGLLALREGGALTIAQSEATSVVYGMPRVAAEKGAAMEVLDVDQIGPRLRRALTPTRDAIGVD